MSSRMIALIVAVAAPVAPFHAQAAPRDSGASSRPIAKVTGGKVRGAALVDGGAVFLTRGLFHRAIGQSGAVILAGDPLSLKDAESRGVSLAETWGAGVKPSIEMPPGRRRGNAHAADVPYVFGMVDGNGYEAIDRAMSAVIQTYWTDFAKTGNPNGAGVPAWPVVRCDVTSVRGVHG